jgi:hypothetical protein
MNIERHISNLKQYIKDDEIIEKDGSDFANFCKGHIDDIQTVLNELEKKDKVIDEMAEWINKQDIDEEICKNNITQPELCNEEGTNCRDCIKEYFYKE